MARTNNGRFHAHVGAANAIFEGKIHLVLAEESATDLVWSAENHARQFRDAARASFQYAEHLLRAENFSDEDTRAFFLRCGVERHPDSASSRNP